MRPVNHKRLLLVSTATSLCGATFALALRPHSIPQFLLLGLLVSTLLMVAWVLLVERHNLR